MPAEIFFSAYPEETVLNVINDRALTHASAGDSPRRVLQRA